MTQPRFRRPEQRGDEREHQPPGHPALHATPQRAPAEREAAEGRPAERRSGEGIVPRLVSGAAAALGRTVIGRAILPLLIVGNVSGCGPDGEGTMHMIYPPSEEPEPQPATTPEETPPEQVSAEPQLQLTRWWAGVMMRGGSLEPVYLGYDETIPYCCVDYDMMYGSREEVPADYPGRVQAAIEPVVSGIRRLFSPDVADALLEGMVLYEKPLRDNPGAGGLSSVGPSAVIDENGQQIMECASQGSNCTFASFRIGYDASVFYHEFFHQFRNNAVSEEDLEAFSEQTTEFFNVYGDNPQSDRFFEALLSGFLPGQDTQLFNPNTIVRDWANETMPDLGTTRSQSIQWSISTYLRIRNTLCQHTTNAAYSTSEGRAALLADEAFAYLGCNYGIIPSFLAGEPQNDEYRDLPSYMAWIYRGAGLSEDYVDSIASGGDYFRSRELFQELIPYIESFSDYMRSRYPELEPILAGSQ